MEEKLPQVLYQVEQELQLEDWHLVDHLHQVDQAGEHLVVQYQVEVQPPQEKVQVQFEVVLEVVTVGVKPMEQRGLF